MASHIEREHQPRESKPNHNENVNNEILLPEKQKQDKNHSDPYENHRNVLIGSSNVGKTYCLSKTLEKIGNKRTIYIKTRSPKQYQNFEASTEIKSIDKYKGSVVSLTICFVLETVFK